MVSKPGAGIRAWRRSTRLEKQRELECSNGNTSWSDSRRRVSGSNGGAKEECVQQGHGAEVQAPRSSAGVGVQWAEVLIFKAGDGYRGRRQSLSSGI